MSLGYQVKSDGTILQEETDEDGNKFWRPFSRLGERRAILNDLSPAATFITYNYNSPINPSSFERQTNRILNDVEKELGWMYETRHTDGSLCNVDYFVWSEVFTCPSCAAQLVFSEMALEGDTGRVRKELKCKSCNSEMQKNDLEISYEENWDPIQRISHQSPKRVPYLIVYRKDKAKLSKKPDDHDLEVIRKISALPYPEFPVVEIPDMQMMRVGRMKPSKLPICITFF